MFGLGKKKTRRVVIAKAEPVKPKSGFGSFMAGSGVMGIAIGIGVGESVAKFIFSVVENLVMPPLNYFLSAYHYDNWQTLSYKIPNTPVILPLGIVLTNLLNVVIIAFVSYLLIRIFLGRRAMHQINTNQSN